ncbi:hypothetical protein [Magnetospirillum sulfuroxidans]|uniref:Uncharacterized protein n=1 Tax=Magnetospirillum sulfuroxidans TaxID=611300 RepID=A0ABS5II44_9PROT|nr:hypothetical protein [Magnetospirillum sulfuroxidans]MBR9973433.1 hypothetical protein [Magnetospirillum sulfuroxidans]
MSDHPEDLTKAMRQRLQALVGDLRRDLGRIDDPQFAALFETSAEVLTGLCKAFADFEGKTEPAWRKLSRRILP